ncbi:MAG TPA: zinc-ribbon domain-containing protein [Gemmataceae bacterium]|nr:zinc-ribbon domain-containing protein [Gemmataceae bacterium]
MSIPTRCPSCDATYNLAESQRGKKVQCRKCSKTFVVGEAPVKAPAATSAGRNSKLRRDGLQTSPQPPRASTPPPSARPSAIRRDRDREDDLDDEEEDDRRAPPPRKKKGGSTGFLLLIGGGVLLVILLGVGGGLFALWWFTHSAPPPDTSSANADEPKDVNDAVLWIQTGQNTDQKNKALDWLAGATVNDKQRSVVAKAIEQAMNDPLERDSALKALYQWAGPENVQTLVRLGSADDQWIFHKKGGPAVDALMRMKDKDANAQASLIKLVAKRLETDAHGDAADLLTQIGPAAENEVLTYLDDPNPRPFGPPACEEARKLLDAWNTTDDRKLNQAMKDLSSPDSGYLQRAAEYLAKTPVVEARRFEASHALENALVDKEEKTRAAAATALKTWGSKDSVQALISEMDTRGGFGESRRACMFALAAIKDEAGADALARHLGDFGEDGKTAEQALRIMGPVARNAVDRVLKESKSKEAVEAAARLKASFTGTDVSLDVLLGELNAQDANQKKQACEKLMTMKVDPNRQKDVCAALIRALADEWVSGVAPAAARALGVWGDKDDKVSVQALIDAMTSNRDPFGKLQQAAMEALVKLKDERAVYVLLPMSETGQPHARDALKALNDMGQPFVETAIDDGLNNPTAKVAEKIKLCQYLKLQGIGSAASLPTLQQIAAAPGSSPALKAAANDAIKAIGMR